MTLSNEPLGENRTRGPFPVKRPEDSAGRRPHPESDMGFARGTHERRGEASGREKGEVT